MPAATRRLVTCGASVAVTVTTVPSDGFNVNEWCSGLSLGILLIFYRHLLEGAPNCWVTTKLTGGVLPLLLPPPRRGTPTTVRL